MSDGGGGPAVAGPARLTAEELRLRETREGVPWRTWGPYLSERQWGTVREDYSENGDAWSYFSHDQARSRAYRWGEDGRPPTTIGHIAIPSPLPDISRFSHGYTSGVAAGYRLMTAPASSHRIPQR